MVKRRLDVQVFLIHGQASVMHDKLDALVDIVGVFRSRRSRLLNLKRGYWLLRSWDNVLFFFLFLILISKATIRALMIRNVDLRFSDTFRRRLSH